MELYYNYYESPVGLLQIVVSDTHLHQLAFIAHRDKQYICMDTELITLVKTQLDEYFRGERSIFTIPLYFEGTTFQKQVWQALLEIPYGEVRSYKEIAEAIGSSKACRAVGGANNKNPITIICPCHRVIGKSGKLVGYGGGLDKKVFLLRLEKYDHNHISI